MACVDDLAPQRRQPQLVKLCRQVRVLSSSLQKTDETRSARPQLEASGKPVYLAGQLGPPALADCKKQTL
jgi:hypothetical protein